MKTFLKFQGKTSPKLRRAVINRLGEIETLLDVARDGAQGGFGNFIYYNNTVSFYKRYKKEIMSTLEHDANQFQISVIQLIADMRCLDGYTLPEVESVMIGLEKDTTQVFNALAWYALESVAYDYEQFVSQS